MAVIRADKGTPRRWDERAFDLSSEFGAGRNILQVGFGARQTCGGGDASVKPTVNAMCLWIGKFGQGVGVCRTEFADGSVIEDDLCNRMIDGFERVLVGRQTVGAFLFGLWGESEGLEENLCLTAY